MDVKQNLKEKHSRAVQYKQLRVSPVDQPVPIKTLLTPVCPWAAGAAPLYHFGLPFLWTASEFEPLDCWSSSPRWRPCAGSAETHSQELMQLIMLLTINNATQHCARSAKKRKKRTHTQSILVVVLGYLSWVGIGCRLAGQTQWVRLGHRVVAVSPQQRVRM